MSAPKMGYGSDAERTAKGSDVDLTVSYTFRAAPLWETAHQTNDLTSILSQVFRVAPLWTAAAKTTVTARRDYPTLGCDLGVCSPWNGIHFGPWDDPPRAKAVWSGVEWNPFLNQEGPRREPASLGFSAVAGPALA